MASHDIGEHLTRAKNSLDHDLSSLAAHASLAGGISELEIEGVPPKKDMFLNFGQGPTSDDWERFDMHASRYAVISMVTSFEVYIERLYFLALLVTHSQKQGAMITYNELSQYRETARIMARNSNPPRMLSFVKEELGISEELRSEPWILSIYRVRKVLAHRGGVVGEFDVDNNDELVVTWQTVEVGQNTGGEQVLRFIDSSRVYRLGDILEISPEDCQEIAFSFGFCADQLSQLFIKKTQDILSSKSNSE